MNIRNLKCVLLSLTLVTVLLSSCATILQGKKSRLVFKEGSTPSAEVYMDGEKIGDAPGKVSLASKTIQHGSVLTLKAEGYQDKEYLILRKQNAVYTVVDLLLGGIPLLVDYTTGNIYTPVPRKIECTLEKE